MTIRRAVTAFLAASLATATFAQAAPQARFGDGGVSAFYRTDGPIPATPGRMIRSEPLEAAKLPAHAARGLRVLYSSTNGVGAPRPIAVSGQVLLPKGTPPKGGWPVIAWAHPTTGVADVCAPSWQGQDPREQAYLDRWLKEGFAIVATDYQGLGTLGPHPYLLYRPEGYGVLDSARAALAAMPGELSNRIVVSGFSQGSGAALGSAIVARDYAPDLKILGVIAIGVVGEFVPQPNPKHPPADWQFPTPDHMAVAYAMLTLHGTAQAMHPDLDAATLVTQAAAPLAKMARTSCLDSMIVKSKALGLSEKTAWRPGMHDYDVWQDPTYLFPTARLAVPVMVATGLADFEAGIVPQYNAVAAMCDAGTRVSWHRYPGVTHHGSVNLSQDQGVPFARALLAGRPPADNCDRLSPVGALQKPRAGVPFND